jgi:hypothetical protein
MLGDLLLELARPANALAEYRLTIAKEPNRFRSLDGAMRAAAASGDAAAASRYKASLRALRANADAAGRVK